MSTWSNPVRPPRVRSCLLTAAAALCLVGGAACTPAPSATSSPSAQTQSAPASSVPGQTPAATDGGSPSADAATLLIDITIANGKVVPNGRKIDVVKGTKVTLNATSDSDDEIHAHTAGDGYELAVKAGEPATGSFVASDVGSFEIESHHLGKVIAILNVR